MRIKFIQSFATDRETFRGGDTNSHEVTDTVAMELVRCGIATVDSITVIVPPIVPVAAKPTGKRGRAFDATLK